MRISADRLKLVAYTDWKHIHIEKYLLQIFLSN